MINECASKFGPVNVMTSRLQVYPRMRLLVMLTQKSPTVSVVKRSNRWYNFPPPVGGRTGRLILGWSGISKGKAAAGPGLPVTFELNVFISCWPFSSSVYISQLIKYPTVGCHPAPTPPHTPKQPHPTKTRPSKFYEEHGHHKKKRWAVGGQYAHEIKKKKMGVWKKKGGANAHLFDAFFWCPSFGHP